MTKSVIKWVSFNDCAFVMEIWRMSYNGFNLMFVLLNWRLCRNVIRWKRFIFVRNSYNYLIKFFRLKCIVLKDYTMHTTYLFNQYPTTHNRLQTRMIFNFPIAHPERELACPNRHFALSISSDLLAESLLDSKVFWMDEIWTLNTPPRTFSNPST